MVGFPAVSLVENQTGGHFAFGFEECQVPLGQQVVALQVLEHQIVALGAVSVCQSFKFLKTFS